jgi:hypothetical protein
MAGLAYRELEAQWQEVLVNWRFVRGETK